MFMFAKIAKMWRPFQFQSYSRNTAVILKR